MSKKSFFFTPSVLLGLAGRIPLAPVATGKHLTEEEEEAESRPLSPQHGGNGNAGARRGGGENSLLEREEVGRREKVRSDLFLLWVENGRMGTLTALPKEERKKELKASFFPLHPNPHPPRVPCREAVIPGSAAERGEETFSKFPETLSFP